PVEVRQVRDVALHAGDVPADSSYRFLEFRLAASGDEDVGTFGDEAPGGGQADAAVAPGDDRDLPFQLLRHGTPPLPVRAVRVTGCKSDCLPRGIRPAGSRRLYQAEQALRDDLPRLLDQLVNDSTGRLDLADQAHALARQQSHRIDVATRLAVRRHAHGPRPRHRLAADYGLADRRLVRARFLAAGLLPEPLLHKGGPQRPVRGVGPAVAEQNGPDRAPLVRLQQPLLVPGMGTRLGAGQKPGP